MRLVRGLHPTPARPGARKVKMRMRRTALKLLPCLLIVALAVAYPQGPGNGNGNGSGRGQGNSNGNGAGQPQLSLSQQVVLVGEVDTVNLGFGARYPSIQVSGETVKIAPVWFLLENDFELPEGDEVRVIAAPSTATTDPYLHALSIVKTATGDEILLRDETGRPLWVKSRGRGQQQQPDPRGTGGQGIGCVDPNTIRVLTGSIEQVSLSAGIKQPTLVVNVDGDVIAVKIGPARVLLTADFELKAGDPITVKLATAACTGELIALELTDGDGITLKIRNDDGSRVW